MAQELNYLYAAAGMETAASGFSMEQELADWSELQYDLLALIARRLNLIEDYLNFGSVCKSWHSVSTKDNFNNYLCRAPWLMLAEEEDDDGNSIRKFFSLYNGMILNKRIPKARRKRCMESMGWLIMIGEEEGEISMLHPFSGVEIELPHQNTTVEYNRYRTGLKMYFFYKAVLSSSPSHTSDYILVVIEGAFKFLSFWRPGDIRWTRLKFQGTDRVGTAFYDLIYFNGQIYALDYSGILIVFDVADAVGTQPTKYHIVAHMPLPPQLRREQLYIVESLGSLFVILRDGVHLRLPKDDRDRIPLKLIPDDDDDDDDYTYGTTNFRVFQVDSAAGIMTETRELGDTTFFLGANSSLSVQACQFPGIKPNHIYFTDDCFLTYLAYEEGGGLDMGVFNLADGSIQPHYNGVSLSRFCPPTWIEIDSKFLEEENIMDYSLLLGVHYRAPQHLQSLISCSGRTTADGLEIVAEEESLEDEISPQGLVLVPRGSDDRVVVGPHVRGSRLRASSATGDAEVDLLLPGTARFQIQLGVNMPARAEYIPKEGQTQVFHEVYDVVLYLGIIDILQEYNMSKKLEHAYKSIQFDSVSISAVDPTYYSERVLEFIRKVFPTYAVAT